MCAPSDGHTKRPLDLLKGSMEFPGAQENVGAVAAASLDAVPGVGYLTGQGLSQSLGRFAL